MDTVRVNICYRPLRIGWAIAAGDHAAFRTAVAMSFALWGGRFNPIVIVDREEAVSLIEVFRCDLIVPTGRSESLSAFEARFHHLIRPFTAERLLSSAGPAQNDSGTSK